MSIWKESLPGRANSMCKSPEVGVGWNFKEQDKATWLDMSESGWMSNMCLNQEEMYLFLKKRKLVSIISDGKQNHSEIPLQSQQEMSSWVSPYW